MKGFYRHKKGNIYEVLFVAKHTETHEDLVIYKDVNDEQKIWARPVNMFLDKGRFAKISKAEAYVNANKQKYRFPNIEFTAEKPNLIKFKGGFSKSVKAMITLLTRKELVDNSIFDKLDNDDDLEALILHKIKSFNPGENLEEIFHLIQIWGGSTGRVIYVMENEFNWNSIIHHYQRLVDTCMSVFKIDEITISKLVDAVSQFNSSVKNMGVSFITKHTRYWLYKTLAEDALPIYDSIMANYVMQRKAPNIRHLAEYWSVMAKKANEIGIALMPLERQIFIFAFELLRQEEIK